MRIWIARRNNRAGLYIPMGGTSQNPNLMFFLPEGQRKQIGEEQLDELVRSQLEKQGITKESDVNAIVEKAEKDYEYRQKMAEAQKEARRLMALRAEGLKLMQVGFRKWKEVFYPAIKKLEKGGE